MRIFDFITVNICPLELKIWSRTALQKAMQMSKLTIGISYTNSLFFKDAY